MTFQASAEKAPVAEAKPLAGFFLSGFLMALAGAVLPVWGYHRDPPEFLTVGAYFGCIAVAVIAAHRGGRWMLARRMLPYL